MQNQKIVLYVTGSIAAYKAVSLLRLLQKQGAEVRVVMTPAAENFVSKLTFASLSKHYVYTNDSFFENGEKISHINLAKWADLSIIAPATADFIAKMSHGIADNFALTVLLATETPKYVVPAMNDVMWQNFATQQNLETLRTYGSKILNPEYGQLAEGYQAYGRMLEPEKIMQKLRPVATSNNLAGKKILITAGGTIEDIDPVRYLSNRSSGKMGYALAEVASNQGATVTLISANCQINPPKNVKVIKVKSSDDLKQVILKQISKNDILIMAAAVSDFKPVKIAKQKLKKTDDHDELVLHLKKTDDILKLVAKQKRDNQIIVGFAAETNDFQKNAQQKLKNKNLDLIILNNVANQKIGFGSDDNQVTIINHRGIIKKTKVESKRKIAQIILQVIENEMN